MTGILSSPHGGFILAPQFSLQATYGVDVSTVRDVIVNNIAHAADQIGQVRVNWSSEVGAYYDIGTAPYDVNAEWVRVCNLGDFTINVRHDGKSYYLRSHVGVASADGSTISARLVIDTRAQHQEDVNHDPPLSTTLSNCGDIQFSSVSADWNYAGVLVLTAEQVDRATRIMSVANDTLGVAIYSTNLLKCYATLWANPADLPNIKVYGCHISEVLEADPAAEVV